MQDSSAPTAFILTGGGSLGAVEVGMLRALAARRVMPDLNVGSSVGAINSVFFAADPTMDGVRRLENIWRGLRREDIFPMGLGGLVRWLTGRQGHLLNPAPLQRLLWDHPPLEDLARAAIPACVIATDVLRGAEVRLQAGPAILALMASTAIPGLFPAVRIDGRLLVDGAVAKRTPISTAIALGATRVVVLPAGYPCARVQAPRGPFSMMLHALKVLTAQQLARDVERYRDRVTIRVVPPVCPLALAAYDFTGVDDVMDRAAMTTGAWLDAGGLDAEWAGPPLAPHSHM
jgi:NTE family protein